MSLDQIDRAFAEFARERAEKVAPGATWEEPELPADANSTAVAAWLEKHPQSFQGMRRLGRDWLLRKSGRKPRTFRTSQGTLSGIRGPGNPYLLLAVVYRRLSDPVAEHKVLEELAMRDGDAIPAYLRLMELDEASGDGRAW